jgi:TolA-binding protein
VEDAEAEFLLENISSWPKHTRSADMLREMARILGNLEQKREFKLKAIITTEDK